MSHKISTLGSSVLFFSVIIFTFYSAFICNKKYRIWAIKNSKLRDFFLLLVSVFYINGNTEFLCQSWNRRIGLFVWNNFQIVLFYFSKPQNKLTLKLFLNKKKSIWMNIINSIFFPETIIFIASPSSDRHSTDHSASLFCLYDESFFSVVLLQVVHKKNLLIFFSEPRSPYSLHSECQK